MTADDAPYHQGLADGRLMVQQCGECQRRRFPTGPVCLYCGAEELDWVEIDGSGVVFSWIRYHKSYLPEFAPLMPYTVACVELGGGLRIVGRILDHDLSPAVGQPARLVVERFQSGRCVPAFALGDWLAVPGK